MAKAKTPTEEEPIGTLGFPQKYLTFTYLLFAFYFYLLLALSIANPPIPLPALAFDIFFS